MAKASKKEIAKRATKVLLNVGTAIAVKKGLDKLNDQDFMQPKKKDDASGKSAFPVVKTAVNGGVGVAGGVAAVMLKNEFLQEVGKGIATAGLMNATETVIDAVSVEGTEGMGNAEKYLSMYDNLSGDEQVPLQGEEENKVPIEGAQDDITLAGDDETSELD